MIKNIALISELEVEFGPGLNLLTGETGSGKSIIVDSLGALTGERVFSELIKEGESVARIEGLFSVSVNDDTRLIFSESGVEIGEGPVTDIIVRRELSLAGKNRIFVNDQMVTQSFLKRIGPGLVDIHGQGEQAVLYDISTHVNMLDEYAGDRQLRQSTAEAYLGLSKVKDELALLESDSAEKLQLIDLLKFQTAEIANIDPQEGEDNRLEEEKRRLSNVEKLSLLSEDVHTLLYESDQSTSSTLERASRKIAELAEYDSRFGEYEEGLKAAQAVIEELGLTARDFRSRLEFSPERLNEIEERLAQLARLKRKYGGSIDTVLAHRAESERRLENIESSEFREQDLRRQLDEHRQKYIRAATRLSEARVVSGKKFGKEVEEALRAVALEKARFEVQIDPRSEDDGSFTAHGFDRVEFYFSANPGESPKPVAKVASGGEASRLMLILKTTARSDGGNAAVFDEIDVGIGGRVAEAVGRKLKELSVTQQVLCVTHQPQIAALADHHFVVEKQVKGKVTSVFIKDLDAAERVEELARMLAGETVTEQARENARAMLAVAG
jgi:DNA repair protein RecN (Recombination protein N)